MLRFDRRLLLNVDWILVATTLFIIMLSVLSLWSLAPRGGSVLAWRQLSWAGIGLLAMLVVISIDYRQLVRAAPVFYLAGLSLLLTVFFLGRTVSGARRWIHLGPFTVQPSEIFKLIFVLALAWALTAWRTTSSSSRGGVLTTFAIIAVPFVLVVRQPDLGTALVLVPVAIAVLVGIGVRVQVLGGLALGGLAVMPLAWLALKPYQRDRLMVYMDPVRDPLGTAYNVIQAKIAIGSGQLFGKGPSGATQSRLAFLPERHTDFIFAVFAEMWGFIGCLVLIVAYALLILRGFEIAASARDPRGQIIALGVTAVFATQTLVNLGMVTGLLPVVGIPLPLMSYGGSSMVASLMGLGLLLSIRMRQFY
jgi:rod shape determining protein RodA